MIRVAGDQTSAQWVTARCGIPTASRFKEIITAKTLAPSKSVKPYIHELLAEWILGEPLDIEPTASAFMERGIELEGLARKAYEFQHDAKITEVGLCLTDDGEVGCSPDGLIGDNGGLEVKTPGLKKHIQYMLEPDTLVEEYRIQLHGSLWVCDRQWWDIMSYNPTLADVFVRVDRDDQIDSRISEAVQAFVVQLKEAQQTMLKMGVEMDQRPIEARLERIAA